MVPLVLRGDFADRRYYSPRDQQHNGGEPCKAAAAAERIGLTCARRDV